MVVEKQKILIVDDRKENLVALRQVLSSMDAEIVEATSGDQALAATLDHDFAIAILDVQMPGMSGYELAEHLRGDSKTRVIPIVFLTAAYADDLHVFSGYDAGAVDYLTKPYSPAILRGKVNVFLQLANYRRVVELHRDHLDALVVEQTGHLTTRVKEIKCLYAVSGLVAESGVSVEASLKSIVNLIVPGWPYREITCATITLEGREFRTDDCMDTPWRLSTDIVTQGMTLGSVEVFYRKERPALEARRFGTEERDFIEDLARHVGIVVQRKRAEEVLRHTEARLSEAQRLAHVGSWELDPVARTLAWSEELYRLFELDPARSAPSYEAWVQAIHPDDRASLAAAYTGALERNAPYAIDHRLLMGDGRVKHVHERCESHSCAAGRPPRLAGTVQDITERKLAEDALLAANQELKRLAALTSAFVSTVSHELRTPLAITTEAISLILDDIVGPITGQQRDLLGVATRNVDRLARIINALLDIAKLEAGMMPLVCSPVDIVAIARQVVSDFQPQAARRRITLSTTASAEGITLSADSDKLVEIFNNLVANALTFAEMGRVEVRITESDDTVECVVADTGIGISAADLPNVFDKFQQFGRVYGPGPKGTGLGLAIVKGLVELHQGTIRVASKVDEGTAFTFILPKCSGGRIPAEGECRSWEVVAQGETGDTRAVAA